MTDSFIKFNGKFSEENGSALTYSRCERASGVALVVPIDRHVETFGVNFRKKTGLPRTVRMTSTRVM